MRELKPGLAHRTARRAPLRYKIAGGIIAVCINCVFVPGVSLVVDPYSESLLALLAIVLVSSVMLVWSYHVATGMMARRGVLD